MADKILLAENDINLLESYQISLERAGFEVREVWDGDMILGELKRFGSNYFDVVLSDTDMIEMHGHFAVRRALEEKLLDRERTLMLGMSDDSNNQDYWRGLAHVGGFFDKDYLIYENGISILGKKVSQALRNFRSGGLWRARMPVIEY